MGFKAMMGPPTLLFSCLWWDSSSNEVCEGYVFTGVCLSTEWVCRIACWDNPPGADTPLGRHRPGQTPPWQTPPCTVHAGIQSTSGWYASNWNAFLFPFTFSSRQEGRLGGIESKYKQLTCGKLFIW